MDPIPFEKVTFEEAKASFQGYASQSNAKPLSGKDWAAFRKTGLDEALELAPQTFNWLAALPAAIRPQALTRQYPRIVNQMAEIWKLPLQYERYLDELMMDVRGDRKGFSQDVAIEIAALRQHFFSTSTTLHFDVWGGRLGCD